MKAEKNLFFHFFLNAQKITESDFFYTYDVTGDVRLMKFKFSEITENWYFYMKAKIFLFLIPGWKPKGSIESGLSVRSLVSLLVSPFVTAYLKNRSKDFFEIWYEVGEQNYKKRHTAAFLNFRLFWPILALMSHIWPYLTVFGTL